METIQLNIPNDLFAFLQQDASIKENFVLDAIREKILRDQSYQVKVIEHPLVKIFKELVLNITPNAKIVLFGSRARGDFRRESDWDFLVLTDLPITKGKKAEISDVIFHLEIDHEQSIDYLLHDKEEWNELSTIPMPICEFVKEEGTEI
ncbi:MAG: nucleotidyltransferase domain-containing protein [Bacteroidota bacterium]